MDNMITNLTATTGAAVAYVSGSDWLVLGTGVLLFLKVTHEGMQMYKTWKKDD